MNNKIFALLSLVVLLCLSACDSGPDPAEQMAAQYDRKADAAPVAAADPGVAAEEEPAAENPCGDAAAENPCGDADAENPCAETDAENPCADSPADNPCADADADVEADNPCADEVEAENPCGDAEVDAEAENPCADEVEAENPCGDADMDEPLMDEEAEDVELDPVDSFMELDPRDILRAKQVDLAGRLTSPWDEDNPDGFIPETGRVDPLTLVNAAIPDSLKPPRSGSTDENEIETYLATIFATQLVDQVANSLQCHSVIEIGVVSTAYFTIAGQQFAMQEGGGRNINGANVTCTGVSDTKVNVTISVAVPGNTVSRSKIYIPRSVS